MQVGLEIVVGEKGGPEAADRQHDGGGQIVLRQRLTVGERDAHARPLRARVLDRKVGLLPWEILGQPHLLQPGLAALPTEMQEILSGRADDVGGAADEIAVAVAVVVDRVRHVFRRHHLGLPELARPGADHLVGAQVAALDQPQRTEQMLAEHVGAPAIEGERGQRFDRLVLPLARPEVALERPERGDNRGRYAEIFVFARKQRGVLLHLCLAALDPPAQHLVRHLEEVLREEALAAIDVDDALIVDHVGRGRGQRGLRDALRQGFFLEGREPGVEIPGVAAIGLGERRRHCPRQHRRSEHERRDGAARPHCSVPHDPLLSPKPCSARSPALLARTTAARVS